MEKINMEDLKKRFGKLRKWNVFVVHNSHTDLGYTHRQEWVYRAHWRYLEKVIDIIDKNPDYIWTVETFWMVENFWSNTSETYKEKFRKYVNRGNIELTSNYLNSTNLMDERIIYNKAIKANNFDKKFSSNVAIFQDVNSIDRNYALSLFDAGTRSVLGSIHSHHGMFAGSGKQRPFLWKLSKDKTMLVLSGEHYQLGNEFGLHGGACSTYTIKDQIAKETSDPFEQGMLRLVRYLEQLEAEGYAFNSVAVVVSGNLADNAAPNVEVLHTTRKVNDWLPENINLRLSRADEYFAELNKEIKKGKSIPTFEGEWPDWWTDGPVSTPEAVRLYREAQRLYHFILSWNETSKQKIAEEKIISLENALALFAEHTWGHWSSVSEPFSNENSLLLSRKKGMANEASKLAWSILDEIRETEGENFVRLDFKGSYIVKNPYKESREFLVPLQIVDHEQIRLSTIDRYISLVDIFKVVDEKGNEYESCLTLHGSGEECVNTSEAWIYLTKVNLKPLEKKILKIVYDKDVYNSTFTSSYRKVGAENVEDLHLISVDHRCKFIQNGIENKFHKIEWEIGKGIISILDKRTNENIVGSGTAFGPVYDFSPNASRRKMGRNRRGPNFVQTFGRLVNVVNVIDKPNVQVVELVYELPGTVYFSQTIRMTSFDDELVFNVKIQKQLVPHPENMYLRLPFEESSEISILRGKTSYRPMVDQILNSLIDYHTMNEGVIFSKKANSASVAIFAPDTPLLQMGSINFEPRYVMGDGIKQKTAIPYVWLMNNYWETNFAGTLEGNYLFTFVLKTGPADTVKKWLENKEKLPISIPMF